MVGVCDKIVTIVNGTYINNAVEARMTFGSWIKDLRHKAHLSQRDFGAIINLPHSLISVIESGDRAVGAGLAEKLADALKLNNEERDNFLILAASTRKRDKLVGYARTMPSQALYFLPKVLRQTGVGQDNVKSAVLSRGKTGTGSAASDVLLLELNDGKQIRCTLALEAAG